MRYLGPKFDMALADLRNISDGQGLRRVSSQIEGFDIPGGGGIAPINGVVVVQHGSNASETRPTAATVYWQGSVAPTNRQLGDLWLETGAYD